MAPQPRPDLRPAVLRLLEELVPAAERGGSVSLSALVAAVAGDRLGPETMKKLDARGAATFTAAGGAVKFENGGPDTTIELKRFNLKIPKRLAGTARRHEDGVVLAFEPKAALGASKLLITIRFESIELTGTRIKVAMTEKTFDQEYLLT